MDNISLKLFDDPSFTIYLSENQFHRYQTKCLHINAPGGRYLESVGHNVQEDNLRMSKTQLREQTALIMALLCNIHTEIELSQDAVLGLADLMCRLSTLSEQLKKASAFLCWLNVTFSKNNYLEVIRLLGCAGLPHIWTPPFCQHPYL